MADRADCDGEAWVRKKPPFVNIYLGTKFTQFAIVSLTGTIVSRSRYKNLTETTKYVTEFIQPLSGKDHDACDAFMCCFEVSSQAIHRCSCDDIDIVSSWPILTVQLLRCFRL